MTKTLLSVRNLTLALQVGEPHALVEGVSFDVPERGVLGIVGESGCGKSVTALSILRLGEPTIAPVAGSIVFDGENLLTASPRRMRQVRGGEISMIFQEPMTSLNPVLTVGFQIGEALREHQRLGRRAHGPRRSSCCRSSGSRCRLTGSMSIRTRCLVACANVS